MGGALAKRGQAPGPLLQVLLLEASWLAVGRPLRVLGVLLSVAASPIRLLLLLLAIPSACTLLLIAGLASIAVVLLLPLALVSLTLHQHHSSHSAPLKKTHSATENWTPY